MRRWRIGVGAVASVGLLVLGSGFAQATPGAPQGRAGLGSLRVPFVANEGQLDPRVAYYAPTFAGTLYVTRRGQLVHALPPAAPATSPGWSLTETFVRGRARPAGTERSATGVSVFRGADPGRWHAALPAYGQVSLGEVWPGIEVSLATRGRSVEKLFTVRPGARVARIRVRVGGARALTLDQGGALVAETGLGAVTFSAPVAYQPHADGPRSVAVRYERRGRDYGFAVGVYDPGLPLVIDPLLQSTYLGGGGGDFATALAIDASTGDLYVAGRVASTNFPGTTGGAQIGNAGGVDTFVARLNGTLTALTQATYLGGGGDDHPKALAINPNTGDVYVAGETTSTDFPGTIGAAQPGIVGGSSAFVARLTGGLTALTKATYLGGSDLDEARALAIDPATGDVLVAGRTKSTQFPSTAGGAQPDNAGDFDAFVARLNSTLTAIAQATYLGGTNGDNATALAIDPATGDVLVAGNSFSADFPGTASGAQPDNGGDFDGFVARLSGTLTALIRATYFGGSAGELPNGVAISATGDVYIAGVTFSTNLPGTTGGAQPAPNVDTIESFVARLTGDLTVLVRATYLGGGGDDLANAIAIHPTTGDVYVAGLTDSPDFPGTLGAAQPANAGNGDLFVAQLNSSLTAITKATYLGGSSGEDEAYALALHPTTGEVYVAGRTTSTDFPGRTGGAQPGFGGTQDAFVARLSTLVHAQSFEDVPTSFAFFAWIEGLFAAGITGGCSTSPALYCPGNSVTRGQIAVFLLRGMHGGGYQPPDATGMFDDVPISGPSAHPLAKWIEELAREGITSGCGASVYCPSNVVTRGQMAVFLLRAKHGAGYQPPDATGMFADVPISGPSAHPLAKWIEALAREGITGGCTSSPAQYCPDAPVTRGQMAVFLVRTFDLPA